MLLSAGFIPVEQSKDRFVPLVNETRVECGKRCMVLQVRMDSDLAILRGGSAIFIDELGESKLQVVVQDLMRLLALGTAVIPVFIESDSF